MKNKKINDLFVSIGITTGFIMLRFLKKFSISHNFIKKVIDKQFPVSADILKEGKLWNRNVEFQIYDPALYDSDIPERIGVELNIRGIWKEGVVSIPFRSKLHCSSELKIINNQLTIFQPKIEKISMLEKVAGLDFNKIVIPLIEKILSGKLSEIQVLDFSHYKVPKRLTKNVKAVSVNGKVIIKRS